MVHWLCTMSCTIPFSLIKKIWRQYPPSHFRVFRFRVYRPPLSYFCVCISLEMVSHISTYSQKKSPHVSTQVLRLLDRALLARWPSSPCSLIGFFWRVLAFFSTCCASRFNIAAQRSAGTHGPRPRLQIHGRLQLQVYICRDVCHLANCDDAVKELT